MSLPSLTGTGITHPALLLSPEGQDVAEAELSRTIGVQVEQEPLQDWALGPLIVKEEAFDMVQEEIPKEPVEKFRDTQQNISGEVAVLGTGIALPTLLLSPEGQDMAEVELSRTLGVQVEQVMNPSNASAPLHMIEQTPRQPIQQSMFWNILQEEGEDMDSVGDEKGTQLKVKKSQRGGKEPLERTRREGRRTQEKVPVKTEVQEERSTSNTGQGTEPRKESRESGLLTAGLGASCSDPSPVETKGAKASFFKYGRRYRPKSRFVFQHKGEECNEGPSLGEKPESLIGIQPESELDEHHSSHMSKSSATHQIIHAEKKTYKCHFCGKNVSQRSKLVTHQKLHTGEKPLQCPECGKKFSQRCNLLRHQNIHTRDKPHKCLNCGRRFSERQNLLDHERIHTREKPYPCPECGKRFAHSSTLLSHERSHTREKPHESLDCGKSFSRGSYFLNHQKFHTGQNPHQCPDCGKSFSQRSDLTRHQKTSRHQK